MTRLTVVAFLTLFQVGTSVLAQEPSEWRPNIAEDNKAATIDDTLTFVVSTANDPSVSRADLPWDKGQDANFIETYGASSPQKCSLEWSVIKIDANSASKSTTNVTLLHLDPLG